MTDENLQYSYECMRCREKVKSDNPKLLECPYCFGNLISSEYVVKKQSKLEKGLARKV
ncbi:MAG TPA: hypothetical protein VJ438_04110 [Candidatus Nanoarchaeia archaeon]|nr:hypothetical protein [Candidatus Nanoarchaeia archaeon]